MLLKSKHLNLSSRTFGLLAFSGGMLCLLASVGLRRLPGTFIGLSDEFWAGFLIGAGGVAIAASIVMNVRVISARKPRR